MADRDKCFWLGTLQYSNWFPTPLQGADMSPVGWESGGTLLNGGGYQFGSWGSHKVLNFEWAPSSSREAAQLLKSYSDGTYGRGLLYISDFLTWDKNVLPARIADPSMAIDNEGGSFVYGVEPTAVSTSGWQTNMLPVQSALYNLGSVAPGFRGVEDATYVPIPEGHTLYLGAFYSATGSGGIFVSTQNTNGTVGAPVQLTAIANDSATVVADDFSGVNGVWIWMGKTVAGPATVTATALIGRIVKTPVDPGTETFGFGEGPFGEDFFGGVYVPPVPSNILYGPWIGGMGNSGVRMIGKPTWEANNPFRGGSIGFAASFREVGSYLYG